jgi:hypothetical protein
VPAIAHPEDGGPAAQRCRRDSDSLRRRSYAISSIAGSTFLTVYQSSSMRPLW